MDIFTAICFAFMDQLTTIGLLFILFGIMIRFLPKWKHFKWCVDVRKEMIKEAELCGDLLKVKSLRKEIYVIENKLPFQGKLLAYTGVCIFIIAMFCQLYKYVS